MKRNTFNLSHEHKTSFDMGMLVPVCTQEVLPGDSFIHNASLLCRVAPLAHPVMHNVTASVHHWFVPNRIVWDEWEDFITGSDSVTHPTITLAGDLDLADRFGMYPQAGLVVNALPFRAFNAIYNYNFRDQDLQTERSEDAATIPQVCWEKDYFTTARASPQQGDAVQIAFSSGEADVKGIGWYRGASAPNPDETTGGLIAESGETSTQSGTGGGWQVTNGNAAIAMEVGNAADFPRLYADLSAATGGIDIDDLRRSIALQRIAEARARFGSRYEDYLRFYGVNPRDGRLSRPEYLGGGKQSLSFSEVIATAEGTTVEVGDLYGHGIGAMKSRRYRKMFEEHGWVITTVYVRPKTAYLQAMPRKFTRTTVEDYWQRELETLPWQQVKHREIYAPDDNDTVFGYVPRFDEYRFEFNYASGSFRTTDKDWHMARDLTSEPTLNGSFVTCDPTDRIYSDTSMPEIQANCYNNILARRLVTRSARIASI